MGILEISGPQWQKGPSPCDSCDHRYACTLAKDIACKALYVYVHRNKIDLTKSMIPSRKMYDDIFGVTR